MIENSIYTEFLTAPIEKRMDGILSHVLFPISNGPLEGTNNMIKSLRRLAFGYRDTRYFFLKIWDASRLHPKSRSYSRFQQKKKSG